MRKPLLILLSVLVLVLAVIFGVRYWSFLHAPLSSTQAIHYVFSPGASVRHLSYDLQQRGYLVHPYFFLCLAYFKGMAKQLKAGEYCFASGITPSQLLEQMQAGKVITYRFTIAEGWIIQQLYEALGRATHLKKTLNLRSPRNFEGLFFPATYYYPLGLPDSILLNRAYRLMQKKLASAWQQRAPNLPYKTAYEALIAASLVEKETSQAELRPLVAGVIQRRLQKNMPLQFDSSVIYGLGRGYGGQLTQADLRWDTPYNTYTRRGLPPAPIAIPSLAAIESVLHPDPRPFLYFIALSRGDYCFSTDLTEHHTAIKHYRLNQLVSHSLTPRASAVCASHWLSRPMRVLLCLGFK